jgi:serine protease SohB
VLAYIGAMKNPLDIFRRGDRVSVIRLEGVIGGASRLGGATLSDASLAPLIEAAFRRGRPKAVALAINSPGGSPAQSSLIAARIRRLSEELHIPVHAFVEGPGARSLARDTGCQKERMNRPARVPGPV